MTVCLVSLTYSLFILMTSAKGYHSENPRPEFRNFGSVDESIGLFLFIHIHTSCKYMCYISMHKINHESFK
jgi:hypothetical protein